MKEMAWRKVRDALKSGTLARPNCCQRCGNTPPPASDGRSQIQAHHHDYSKPLDVEWICAGCHRAETPLPKTMGAPAYGESNGQAKLCVKDVIEMKQIRASTGQSYARIAARFGVDKRTAMRAIKGEQWALAAAPSQPVEPGKEAK